MTPLSLKVTRETKDLLGHKFISYSKCYLNCRQISLQMSQEIVSSLRALSLNLTSSLLDKIDESMF